MQTLNSHLSTPRMKVKSITSSKTYLPSSSSLSTKIKSRTKCNILILLFSFQSSQRRPSFLLLYKPLKNHRIQLLKTIYLKNSFINPSKKYKQYRLVYLLHQKPIPHIPNREIEENKKPPFPSSHTKAIHYGKGMQISKNTGLLEFDGNSNKQEQKKKRMINKLSECFDQPQKRHRLLNEFRNELSEL